MMSRGYRNSEICNETGFGFTVAGYRLMLSACFDLTLDPDMSGNFVYLTSPILRKSLSLLIPSF